jgi:hypothetical protein
MKTIFPFLVLLVIFSLCILVCLLFLIMLVRISIFSWEHAILQGFFVVFGCGFCLETSLTHQLSTCILFYLCSPLQDILFINFFFKYSLFVEVLIALNTLSHLWKQYLNNAMWFTTFKPYWANMPWRVLKKRLWVFMHTFLTQGWNCLK